MGGTLSEVGNFPNSWNEIAKRSTLRSTRSCKETIAQEDDVSNSDSNSDSESD